MSLKYHQLDSSVEKQIKENISKGILSSYRFMDENAVRRNMEKDKNSVLRPSFGRDIEKILHLPLYNRYNDKTQVFSFYNNDDITRRGLHVQLVSRISRNIGRMLGLNLDLIESIALGHDVGHTPFGHAGERYLSELLQKETGRHFNHNVHSIRVLDILYRRNISLQTLDGILCHNGEFELNEYRPQKGLTFEQYDNNVELCYTEGGEAIKKLVPSTLEGCVVRICDILAYIGKDRQDAITAKILSDDSIFSSEFIGSKNAEMINNLTVILKRGMMFETKILKNSIIYFIVATQVKELANPLSMRVCEFFCFTIKTVSEQPLTTARKLMLYLSYIAYPCSIFLLAHDPIPHSPVNKTQNPTCRHRQPYCRYAYDRYQGVGENNSEREIYYASG